MEGFGIKKKKGKMVRMSKGIVLLLEVKNAHESMDGVPVTNEISPIDVGRHFTASQFTGLRDIFFPGTKKRRFSGAFDGFALKGREIPWSRYLRQSQGMFCTALGFS